MRFILASADKQQGWLFAWDSEHFSLINNIRKKFNTTYLDVLW